jgi:hypothetical protein
MTTSERIELNWLKVRLEQAKREYQEHLSTRPNVTDQREWMTWVRTAKQLDGRRFALQMAIIKSEEQAQ